MRSLKYILLFFVGLILLMIALLFLRIRFEIILCDSVSLRLSILGLKFKLYPPKKKKVSLGKFKKGYPVEKEQTPQVTERKKTTSKKDDIPLSDKISTVTYLIKQLVTRLSKHLRLDISKIIVIVGGKDPAACAISYGIISQSVAYLLEFLDHSITVHKKRKGNINVVCDFTNDKTVYDVFISLSLNVWQIIDITITLVYNYLNGTDILNVKQRFNTGDNNNGRK